MHDVIEAPAAAGRLVLGRLDGHATGPVAECGGRSAFLVEAGGAGLLPELLGWFDWHGIELGLAAHPSRQREADPRDERCPVRHDCAGSVRWLRTTGTPPALDLTAPGSGLARLVSALAGACHLVRLSGAAGGNGRGPGMLSGMPGPRLPLDVLGPIDRTARQACAAS